MIHVPPDTFVPPSHLAALEAYMANKPGDWKVFLSHPQEMKYTLHLDMDDMIAQVTVQLDTEPLFDMNREDEADSQGKRFGDGQVVARVPMHLLYSEEIGNPGKAMDEGDRKHLRRILNDSDFRKFRSFRGIL